MGASSKYLVIYHAISAGQNGPNLGCDEEEIVMILYLILNVAENKVSLIHMKPSTRVSILTLMAWIPSWKGNSYTIYKHATFSHLDQTKLNQGDWLKSL